MNNKLNIIYTRVSTDMQAKEGFSLTAHKNYLIEYCETNNLDNIYHIEDAGLSGTKVSNRHGFKEMIKLITEKKVSRVIFVKGDRICRNVRDHYELIELCNKYNVTLISVMENTNLSTADGRFVAGIFLLGAQLESEKISERVIFAYIEMLKEGKYPLGRMAFLGIDRNKVTKELYYTKDIYIVEEIFHLFNNEKWSMNRIYKKMAEKYPDKWKWHKDSIKHILNNTLYRGYMLYRGERYELLPPIANDVRRLKESIILRNSRLRKYPYKFKNILYHKDKLCICRSTKKFIKSKNEIVIFKYYKCVSFTISEIEIEKIIIKQIKADKEFKTPNINDKIEILDDLMTSGRIGIEEYLNLKDKITSESNKFDMSNIKRINIINKKKVQIDYRGN